MRPLIELRNVTFGYGSVPVLQDVSVHLHAGQFAALVGPSGAGKSTFLKLVLGTLQPTRGTVEHCAEVLGDDCKRDVQIGYIPQLETVDWNFPVTVGQVVLMGLTRKAAWLPWHSGVEKRKLDEVLSRLEINSLANRHIRDLSGGQQQRVFLARALIAEPDLLVLDEPTSGVDIRTAQSVMHLLADLNQRGMTVLLTTHDLNLAAAHVPWVICLNRKVMAQGTPDDVFTEPTLNATYNGDMLVLRQDDMLLIHERPHGHNWRENVPNPVLGHAGKNAEV